MAKKATKIPDRYKKFGKDIVVELKDGQGKTYYRIVGKIWGK